MNKRLIATTGLVTVLQIQAQSQPAATLAFAVASIRPVGDTITIPGLGRSFPRANFSYEHSHSVNSLPGIAGNKHGAPYATLTGLVIVLARMLHSLKRNSRKKRCLSYSNAKIFSHRRR